MVIAQSLEEAEFDGMPRAMIQTSVVDFALTLEEMPPKLVLLWERVRSSALPHPSAGIEVHESTGEAKVLAEEALISIKAILRERTGHDFANYKRGTVLHRIERRIQVNVVADLSTYRQLLDTRQKKPSANHSDWFFWKSISEVGHLLDSIAFQLELDRMDPQVLSCSTRKQLQHEGPARAVQRA